MPARGLWLLVSLALIGCGRDPAPAARRGSPEPSPTPTALSSAARLSAPIKPQAQAPTPPAAPAATPAAASPPAVAPPPHVPVPIATAPSRNPGTAPGRPAAYAPKDECATLPGFAAFRARLVAAVRKRDSEALVGLSSPDIKLDFGGGGGRDELTRRLVSRPELWNELGEILRLGCAADAGLATLPWIFSRMPDSIDAYRGLLVLGDKVPLRERPAAEAPVRGELGWALVMPVAGGFDPKARYVEVETTDKALRGFVDADRLRSLLDFRVIAEADGVVWMISAFIAGD